jgi:hypothetical protein
MITCGCCGTNWKSKQRESKPRACDDRVIYGCIKCSKGAWDKNKQRGDFKYGEWEEETK